MFDWIEIFFSFSFIFIYLLEEEMWKRWKVTIPLNRLEKSFSRGSGNGGQNLHASHSRCLIKFNLFISADWLPHAVREVFYRQYGDFVSPRGTVVIAREDSRSASDNEKLAVKQLQAMLDKAEELACAAEEKLKNTSNFSTEQERIKASKSQDQIQRYKDRMLFSKRMRSHVKSTRQQRD